ncbi:hypothetical protein M8C21_025586, partial [Ambrosia artemisiifolia]
DGKINFEEFVAMMRKGTVETVYNTKKTCAVSHGWFSVSTRRKYAWRYLDGEFFTRFTNPSAISLNPISASAHNSNVVKQ